MGEYATYQGSEIKIGTCEDMYYLRWDQVNQIQGYTFSPEDLGTVRFRFPFPDEDGSAPGSFERYDRGQKLYGFEFPADLEHGLVQFKADNGYLVSLPCPEGPQDSSYTVHRNGYGGQASLVQQGWRGGRLVGIARCNGCHHAFRLEDGYEDQAATIIRSEADGQIKTADQNGTEGNREIGHELHTLADRLLEGYSQSE